MAHYYIESDGEKDGPHDMVTIMRRIRMQKIYPQTMISVGSFPARPAGEINELVPFFHRTPNLQMSSLRARRDVSLGQTLAAGWQFTQEHSAMTVYAGCLLLLSVLLGAVMVNASGWVAGGITAWGLFVLFTNLYFIFTLRAYRGQMTDANFLNRKLAPILSKLVSMSFLLAVMMLGGTMLLIIPGLLVMSFYIFTPFVMLDEHSGIVKSMAASRRLISTANGATVFRVMALTLLYLVSLALIVPIPVMLPLYAAALCEMYENLVAEQAS